MSGNRFVYISFILAACLTIVTAQRCPANWFGYSLKSKCYRVMVADKMTWQDARDFCQIHGGDLLRIDTVQERNWIFNTIKNLNIHNKVPPSNWWIGLNNREYLTKWEWADGAPAANGILTWARGAPNNANGTERCGEIVNQNKFNDEDCSDQNKFICWRDRGIPLKCDADHGWQTLNGACYKVYTQKRNWNGAKRQCSHDGGSIVTIDNQNDEIVMHDFAVNNHQPLWLGLYTVKVGNQQPQWMWTNGTSLSTNYWHGTPHIDRAHQNSTCAVISNSLPVLQAWNPSSCTVNRAFVCRKPEGVCLPGWIGHRQYCWQFNIHYRLNFGASNSFCRQQGAQLLKIASDSDQQFVDSYIDEMKNSGVTSFWIGASDNNNDTGSYKWRDGSPVTYKLWAGRYHNHTTNTKGRQDCVFIPTNDPFGQWRSTSSCQSARAFVCKIPMGKQVTAVSKTPRPVYGCPADWKRYQSYCFNVAEQALDWATARNACQQTQGADLAKITTANMQGFVNRLLKRDIIYWIGLNDRSVDNLYVWNDETAQLSGYTNWKKGEPNNYLHRENCVVNTNGQWNDYTCYEKRFYICSMIADSVLPSLPPSTPRMDWTVKCGTGWESNPTSEYCYKFVDEPLSWLDAKNQCQNYKGRLVAIESLQEINYLAGRMQAMNSLAVWTGANDRASEGGWKWANGKPFAFLNWAPGQPSSGGLAKGQDCVAMFTQSALWDDVDCNTRNGYICEKRGRVPRTKPPPTVTVKVPAGMVLGCRTGWLPFRDSCYRVIKMSSTYADADTTCGRNGGKLASILDRNENNFIAGNLPKPTLSTDGFWIGLNDKQIDNLFQWTDGSAVTYTNWNTNEPNNFFNRNEDCVEMRLNNGKWNDAVCTQTRPGFICKAKKAPVSATQAPYQKGCPQYTQGVGAYCYKEVNYGKPLSFVDANAMCNRTLKGTLATVNDRILQAFLASSLVWRTGYFWIGLSDTVSPGTYSWLTGESVKFTNWYNTHTGNERSTCVAMRTTAPTGLWENLDCSQPNYFICQFPRQGYTPTTQVTLFPNLPCPAGWTANQGMCLKAYPSQSTVKTWMEALAFCQSLGGDLASFHKNSNASVLSTLLASYRGKNFWIGLNDRNQERGHEWSDGSAVDYTNWNPGEPNDANGYEDCVVVSANGNRWNDYNCYSSLPYICAVPRGTKVQVPTLAPTGITASACGPNWILYNGNCYQASPSSGDNSSLSWYDANTYCMNQGSNFVSMHSQQDHSFVLSYLSKQRGVRSYWIGLNMLTGNSFQWTDMTPVDFDYWGPNEPNDYFGSERCTTMQSSAGIWNDDLCSNPKPFICEKPVNGAAKIATPSPYPPGGCANGFTRVPGGRNKCFYIGGRNLNARMNWTSAYSFCRRFGTGYDIASVEDLFEQDFLITMARGSRLSLWIGLNDRRGNNKFFWQDSSPVFYTNWDRGEPTSGFAQNRQKAIQNCVVMRMYSNHEGKWADSDCSQKIGYVCQAKQDPNLPIFNPTNNCKVSGYKSYGSSCYRVSSKYQNWTNAQADCKRDNGNLVSVTSVQESAFVVTLVNKNYSYWIGLSDTQVRGLYSWVDGWPVVYSNWGWKEPSYGQRNTTGCVIANKNGKWNDTDCSRKLHYVCEISSASPPKTTPQSIGTCANPSWIPHGDYCYYVSITSGRSWPEANYLCQNNGQQLASIHSQAELDFIVGRVRQAKSPNPTYRPNVWIGLTQGGLGSYQWTDGSTLNFIKWSPGEPTSLGQQGQVSQCVELDRDKGSYNDLSCFTNRGFVCKSMKVTSTPAPSINNQGQGGQGSGPGRPTGNNVLPTYKVNMGSGGVAPGQGVSQLPFITNANGQIVTDANGQPVTAGALAQSNILTNNSNLGLSNGGIAGVVIACMIVLIVVAFGLIYLKRSGRIKPPVITETMGSGFENALYNKSDDNIKLETDA